MEEPLLRVRKRWANGIRRSPSATRIPRFVMRDGNGQPIPRKPRSKFKRGRPSTLTGDLLLTPPPQIGSPETNEEENNNGNADEGVDLEREARIQELEEKVNYLRRKREAKEKKERALAAAQQRASKRQLAAEKSLSPPDFANEEKYRKRPSLSESYYQPDSSNASHSSSVVNETAASEDNNTSIGSDVHPVTPSVVNETALSDSENCKITFTCDAVQPVTPAVVTETASEDHNTSSGSAVKPVTPAVNTTRLIDRAPPKSGTVRRPRKPPSLSVVGAMPQNITFSLSPDVADDGSTDDSNAGPSQQVMASSSSSFKEPSARGKKVTSKRKSTESVLANPQSTTSLSHIVSPGAVSTPDDRPTNDSILVHTPQSVTLRPSLVRGNKVANKRKSTDLVLAKPPSDIFSPGVSTPNDGSTDDSILIPSPQLVASRPSLFQEPLVRGKKVIKCKSTEYMLANPQLKHRRRTIEVTPESRGLRRSKRTRVAPLDYALHQRPIYQVGLDGLSTLVGVTEVTVTDPAMKKAMTTDAAAVLSNERRRKKRGRQRAAAIRTDKQARLLQKKRELRQKHKHGEDLTLSESELAHSDNE